MRKLQYVFLSLNSLTFYRQELLRVWQSKNRLTATYKNLLGIFIKAEHEAGAKAVCEVLHQKGIIIINSFPVYTGDVACIGCCVLKLMYKS